MALYNNEKNFIFFHLYKCGGMSLRKFLSAHVQGSKELLGGHAMPKEVKKHYVARHKLDKFNEMFKFTIVRNPFDFVLSTFHYARTYTNHFMHDDVIRMDFKKFPDYYMDWREKHIKENIHGKNKVCTIYEFLHDDEGKPIMDFIARLENINEDMKIICEKTGAPYSMLPKHNVNRNNDKPYRQVYDAETRKKVEEYFAKDFEFLNYEF